MQWGIENLELVRQLLGPAARIVDDDPSIVSWVKKYLPLGISSIEWWHLPDALIISLPPGYHVPTLISSFEQLVAHVAGHEADQVVVFWKGIAHSCTLSLADCRQALPLLLHVDGVTYLLAPEARWGIEFNAFHNEVYGARISPSAERAG